MSAPEGGKRIASANVRQLDVLRGVAIVLMIVNHAGLTLMPPDWQRRPIPALLIFAGSFAPVLFFFATGFGIGIARTTVNRADLASTALKALLLVIADQFFFWKSTAPYGLDFLSFIGISTVLLTMVAMNARPVRLCAVLIAAVLVCRFAAGPLLRQHAVLPAMAEWFIGIRPLDRISYPFAPWIIYPLLGFMLARRYRTNPASLIHLLWPWTALVAVVGTFIAFIMFRSHEGFFRWGTVNLAYFALSMTVIFMTLVIVWQVSAHEPRPAGWLALRGIASLAVVPIHYALIGMIDAFDARPQGVLLWVLLFIGLIAVSILAASAYARLVQNWMQTVAGGTAWRWLAALALVSGGSLWLAPQTPAAFGFVVTGQLAIAGLLSARDRSRKLRASPQVIAMTDKTVL